MRVPAAPVLHNYGRRSFNMRLLYFFIISAVLFALNVACGADYSTPYPAVSAQENTAQDDSDWRENPSAPMTCLRIAYDHYLGLGDTPRNAWNNAVTACGRGMDSTCP